MVTKEGENIENLANFTYAWILRRGIWSAVLENSLFSYLQDLNVTWGKPSPHSILFSFPPSTGQSLSYFYNFPRLESQTKLVLLSAEGIQTFTVRSRHCKLSLFSPCYVQESLSLNKLTSWSSGVWPDAVSDTRTQNLLISFWNV